MHWGQNKARALGQAVTRLAEECPGEKGVGVMVDAIYGSYWERRMEKLEKVQRKSVGMGLGA